MDISASALTAQRMRMDVIAENIANSNTTRTATGGPYRRRVTILQQMEGAPFSSYLQDAQGRDPWKRRESGGYRRGYVRIQATIMTRRIPDAGPDGYVRLPNVDEVTEMVDMMSATRSYEANVTALNAIKSMAMKALEIGK